MPRYQEMARFRWPHRTTAALAIFAAVNFFGISAAIHRLAPRDFRPATTSLYAREFLLGQAEDDSWTPMQASLDQMSSDRAKPLYQAIFFAQKIKFQYPPSSLLALDLMDHLSGDSISIDTLNRISWVSIFLLAAIVPATYLLALRKFNAAMMSQFGTLDLVLQAGLLSLMTLTFYPVTQGFILGNIQTWLTFLFGASVLAWVCGYEAVAGILIGLIVAFKPQLVLLLAWAILRGRRGFLIGCAAIIAGVEALSVYQYGLKNQVDYLPVLSFLSAHGESFYANQSMNGLLARMLHIGNNAEWLEHDFPPFHPLVYWGTVLTSAVMIGFALFAGRTKTDEKSLLISYLSAALLITMASPIAWEHHYGIMVSIYACVLALLMGSRPRRQGLIVAAISYMLASNLFLFANLSADSIWNFIQSYLLAAGALLVLILFRYAAVTANRPVKAEWPLRTE
jgi:hypothetical protein